MPRAPNPKVSEAEQLVLKGYKLIDIAKELQLPEGTIRRWKSTYKWNSQRSHKKIKDCVVALSLLHVLVL